MDSWVWRTVGDDEKVKCSQIRASKSVEHWSSSERYDGAVPCRHLYMRTASLYHMYEAKTMSRLPAYHSCTWALTEWMGRRTSLTYSGPWPIYSWCHRHSLEGKMGCREPVQSKQVSNCIACYCKITSNALGVLVECREYGGNKFKDFQGCVETPSLVLLGFSHSSLFSVFSFLYLAFRGMSKPNIMYT